MFRNLVARKFQDILRDNFHIYSTTVAMENELRVWKMNYVTFVYLCDNYFEFLVHVSCCYAVLVVSVNAVSCLERVIIECEIQPC